MPNAQWTINQSDRSDGNAFAVPGDTPGTDQSFRVQSKNLVNSHQVYVHIDNGWDQNVDVTVQGSHWQDEAMDSAVADATAKTINSGTTDFVTVTEPHTFVEALVDPTSTPTSGDLVITIQSRVA